eukprot:COSAG01_NODE_541_length_15735_cov_4.534088_3_plen_69_part_00
MVLSHAVPTPPPPPPCVCVCVCVRTSRGGLVYGHMYYWCECTVALRLPCALAKLLRYKYSHTPCLYTP